MEYKKIFVDSDIILDLFFQRQPFFKFSQVLFNETIPELELATSTLVLANVYYLLRKHVNKTTAKSLLKDITEMLQILSFEEQHILSAINNDHADFEDSIQYDIAMKNNCGTIITRNIKDYKHATIPVLTAEQFLRTL